jgi:hypothetical protein
MGGLARRATFTKQFLKEHAGEAVFQVDAGGLFNHRANDLARSRALLEGLAGLGVGIVNLTPGDAAELEKLGMERARLGRPGGRDARAPWLPQQFVTANVFGPRHQALAPPFVVRRTADGARIVFLGLSAADPLENFGYAVDDPKAALKRLLAQVGGSADFLILLAFMPQHQVLDIATNFQNLDIIVSGYGGQFGIAPYQIGHVWVLHSQYEGRFVGHAGLQLNAEKRLARLEPNGIVALDSSFADDPEMAALIAPARPAPPGGKTP